ncbi:chromatin accessibility complex protein 1-like [Diprion similis]|uniref:chromatin accessibility complex protein 1-like n=1 Tax=Diprion similis TaxID=362088 RepID=UPI001EF8D3FC|nr:chromatin accessibility complex protein 1-like [Diprion similis]
MASQASPHKPKDLHLPLSRVKTIMKSSPYVETVGQDCLFLVAKATELFIHHLTVEAHRQGNKSGSLDYKNLAEVVQTSETLEFLREIVPRKITVREFKEMMAKKNPVSSDSSSSESSSDSDSDSESDSTSSHDDGAKKRNGNGDANVSSSSSDESVNKDASNKENGQNQSSDSEEDSNEG